MGNMPPLLHLKCVTLLHQLHNLVPNPNVIERILARSLCYGSSSSDNDHTGRVDAYQRFTLLWHLSRELELKACGKKPRTFDICLLKMLDNLNLSSGPLKALAQSWLVHALAKGDIARLMEPLFITLLDPSTARLSVLHAKIVHADTVDAVEGEKHHIFSISSSNQEAIYHVSSSSQTKCIEKAKRIFALNRFQKKSPTTRDQSQAHVHPIQTNSSAGQTDTKENNDLLDVTLMVNPFALVPPDLEEYQFYTKGYENMSSDSSSDSEEDDNSKDEQDSSRPESSLSVAKLFGEDSEVNEQENKKEITGTQAKQPSSMEASFIQTSSSAGSDLQNKNLSIHPLHSHLLLYCQVCDSRQILYTMQCIKNVIMTNPRLAICTLSTTNLNATNTGRKNQIQMLLARHRKSVFGKNFAGSLSSENLAIYRNSTLIEVLISTLLYYLRSYYPNLGQVRLSDEEIQSNREVSNLNISSNVFHR